MSPDPEISFKFLTTNLESLEWPIYMQAGAFAARCDMQRIAIRFPLAYVTARGAKGELEAGSR